MQLLAAWKDSLQLLLPQQLKLFSGALFLSLRRTYHIWLGAWWWLLACIGVLYWCWGPVAVVFFHEWNAFTVQSIVGFPFILIMPTFDLSPATWVGLLLLFLYIVLIFMVYLSARPSVNIKTYDYFLSYPAHLLLFIGWFFLVRLFLSVIVSMQLVLLILTALPSVLYWLIAPPVWLLAGMGMALCMGITVFYVFFLLDGPSTLVALYRSLRNAIKMSVLSLPLVVLVGVVSCLGMIILSFLCVMVASCLSLAPRSIVSLLGIAHILAVPMPVAFFATLYTKRLYDNSALYLE